MPLQRVWPPALRLSMVREKEPPTGKAPEIPAARLAMPWLTSSRSALQRWRVCVAMVRAIAAGSAKADQGDDDAGDDELRQVLPGQGEADRRQALGQRADDGALVAARSAPGDAGDHRDQYPREQRVDAAAAEDQGQREAADRRRLRPTSAPGARCASMTSGITPSPPGGDAERRRQLAGDDQQRGRGGEATSVPDRT